MHVWMVWPGFWRWMFSCVSTALALAVSGVETPATAWVLVRAPVTMIGLSKSIEPVDCAIAGDAMAMGRLAALMARNVLSCIFIDPDCPDVREVFWQNPDMPKISDESSQNSALSALIQAPVPHLNTPI